MLPVNQHATAVALGDRGILIIGPSGAGKTSLALELIETARTLGRFARLVGDDQLFVRATHGRLVARAPDAIRGLVEIRGLGPRPAANEDQAVIDMVVRLIDAGDAPRFQEHDTEKVAGVNVPAISLAARNARAAVPAILSQLPL